MIVESIVGAIDGSAQRACQEMWETDSRLKDYGRGSEYLAAPRKLGKAEWHLVADEVKGYGGLCLHGCTVCMKNKGRRWITAIATLLFCMILCNQEVGIEKFPRKFLKQILLLISCFFSSLIVKFGEIHKLGFMSWIRNPEAHTCPHSCLRLRYRRFPRGAIAEKAVAAVIGYRDRNPCRPAVRGGVRERGC